MGLLFDTFMTLFGLPIMAGKVISERSYHKSYTNATQAQFDWRHAKLRELAAPNEEFNQIKTSIDRRGLDACDEIKDELIAVFGPDYKETMKKYFISRPYPEDIYDYHYRRSFWLRQMMLAKRGYIEDIGVESFKIIKDETYPYAVAMCKQIEKMLHQAGHTDMLLYAGNLPNPYGTPAISMEFLSKEYVDACRSGRVRLSYWRLW